MRFFLWIASLAGLLLAGCETRRPAATVPSPPVAAVPPAPVVPRRPVTRLLRDTLDVSDLEYDDAANTALLDTLLRLGTRHYRLRLQAQSDSSQELAALPPDQVAVDSVAIGSTADDRLILGPKHHYNVRYTITLLDSAGRRQFRRTFTKPDFYQLAGRELVRESEPIRPAFIGYNAPRQWLLLRQAFGVEGTDWGGEAFLALDLKGRPSASCPATPTAAPTAAVVPTAAFSSRPMGRPSSPARSCCCPAAGTSPSPSPTPSWWPPAF